RSLSELPSVSPKPRSSGSATKVALRRASVVAFFSSALGFFISCQFFALTAMNDVPFGVGETGARCLVPNFYVANTLSGGGANRRRKSHAAALGRAHAIMRD